MKNPLETIHAITGRKPTECKCDTCRDQCKKTPCLGTPQDIEKIIDAGFIDQIKPTGWAAGILMGVMSEPIFMFQAELKHTGCVFFKDGLCQLHDLGLKPTEGKLSHHSIGIDNLDPKKSITWLIAQEWFDFKNLDTIKRISRKIHETIQKEGI